MRFRSDLLSKLQEGPISIGAKTGTTGKIFGSITTVQISKAVREQKGYEIDRRRIHLLDEIKEIGSYKAKVDFGNGNEAEIAIEIVAE